MLVYQSVIFVFSEIPWGSKTKDPLLQVPGNRPLSTGRLGASWPFLFFFGVFFGGGCTVLYMKPLFFFGWGGLYIYM